MSDPFPSRPDGLLHLDTLSFDFLLAWLERALRGREPLPTIVPDETPESAILRERRLSPRTRDDLREACLTLIARFVREPKDSDDYVLALLRLATGFQLEKAAIALQSLADDEIRFPSLTEDQNWAVISTIFDLRAPLPLAFWKRLAARQPARLGVMAVSGLLTHGYDSAFQVLPTLPDDESIADALYIALDQHSQLLNPVERQKMMAAAAKVQIDCRPQIQSALQDLIRESPDVIPEVSAKSGSKLGTALAAYFTRSNTTYNPRPCTARLITV